MALSGCNKSVLTANMAHRFVSCLYVLLLDLYRFLLSILMALYHRRDFCS